MSGISNSSKAFIAFCVVVFFWTAAVAQLLLGVDVSKAPGGGGGGTWTLTAHAKTSGVSSGTTSAVNTTGAKLFVVSMGCATGSGSTGCSLTSISDSSSNTYSEVGTGGSAGGIDYHIFYVISPTTNASQTFSFSCDNHGSPNCFAAMEVQAWTESGTPTVDQHNFGAAAATSTTTGSITPTVSNSLVVSGAVYDGASGSSFSIDSGMTLGDSTQLSSGVNEGGAIASLQQGSAAAINPTWSASTATQFIAGIVDYKP